jgi:hypothetical protein
MANPNIAAHHTAIAVAKGAHQVAFKAATDEAGRLAATITYHKAILASGRLNGVKCNSIAQLQRLGVDPGDWTSTD